MLGKKTFDWSEVQRFYDAGNDRDACMAMFGFSISSWYKARAQDKLVGPGRVAIDWSAVQAYYDVGHTFLECRQRFGFSSSAWSKAVRRGWISPRDKRFTLERLLAHGRSRCSIKRRLLEAGLLKNACDACGVSEWMGRPLSIQLHHRNGIRNDHSLSNLMMLCPNCHSQTSTFGTRNRKQMVQTPRS
jgi:hypothetical protein